MVLINTNLTKKPARIEQTKESQQARSLENRLLIDFNTILEFIRDSFDFKSSDYVTQLQDIRNITYSQTYAVIRHYYQEAYLLGTNFVNDVFVSSPFITHSDLDEISKHAEEYTNRFYGRLLKVLQKGNKDFYMSLFNNITNASALINDQEQIDLFAKQLEKASSYLYTSLAVLIISEALNTATINKTKKLMQPQLRASGGFMLQAGKATNKALRQALEEEQRLREENRSDALRASGFFVIPLGSIQPQQSTKSVKGKIRNMDISKMRYKWIAHQDDRTCSQCSLLDGTEYTTADDFIPTIPDSSHFSCRCRIIPISSSFIDIE